MAAGAPGARPAMVVGACRAAPAGWGRGSRRYLSGWDPGVRAGHICIAAPPQRKAGRSSGRRCCQWGSTAPAPLPAAAGARRRSATTAGLCVNSRAAGVARGRTRRAPAA
eukprot:gene20017-biopygen22081